MKLNEIQQKLKAPKSQYNSFGKYHYRNAEDILEAVKPLLGGSVLILTDEVVNVGNRNYVKATATFYEETDKKTADIHTATAFACESEDRKGMDAAQITGAASSYARKYALNGLFLIDDTKDADSGEAPEKAPQPRQATRTAAKPTEATKDPVIELKAAKERTMTLLALLDYIPPAGTTAQKKKYYEDTVFDLTGYILADKDIDTINEKLAALVEK